MKLSGDYCRSLSFYSECSGIPSVCKSCVGGPRGYITKNIKLIDFKKNTTEVKSEEKKNCRKCECLRKVLKWFSRINLAMAITLSYCFCF